MSRQLSLALLLLMAVVTGGTIADAQEPAKKPAGDKKTTASEAKKKAPALPQRLVCRVSGSDATNITIVNGTPTDIAAGAKIAWTVAPGSKRCRAPVVSDLVAVPGVLPPGGTITFSVPDARASCATRCDVEFKK